MARLVRQSPVESRDGPGPASADGSLRELRNPLCNPRVAGLLSSAGLDIMEPGGARAPVEILEEIDIDVNSPALWQGFDVIRALIRQLEVVCA
jgi:hypothetical protein